MINGSCIGVKWQHISLGQLSWLNLFWINKKKSRKAGRKRKGRRPWRKLGTVTAMSIIMDAERFPILKWWNNWQSCNKCNCNHPKHCVPLWINENVPGPLRGTLFPLRTDKGFADRRLNLSRDGQFCLKTVLSLPPPSPKVVSLLLCSQSLLAEMAWNQLFPCLFPKRGEEEREGIFHGTVFKKTPQSLLGEERGGKVGEGVLRWEMSGHPERTHKECFSFLRWSFNLVLHNIVGRAGRPGWGERKTPKEKNLVGMPPPCFLMSQMVQRGSLLTAWCLYAFLPHCLPS